LSTVSRAAGSRDPDHLLRRRPALSETVRLTLPAIDSARGGRASRTGQGQKDRYGDVQACGPRLVILAETVTTCRCSPARHTWRAGRDSVPAPTRAPEGKGGRPVLRTTLTEAGPVRYRSRTCGPGRPLPAVIMPHSWTQAGKQMLRVRRSCCLGPRTPRKKRLIDVLPAVRREKPGWAGTPPILVFRLSEHFRGPF